MALKKIALRYSQEWRDSLKFKDVSYLDFVTFLQETGEKLYFSEKIDGELNTLNYEKESDPFFLTKSGVVRSHNRNYPVIQEYKDILNEMEYKDIVIAGELKAIHDDGVHYPLNESQSITQTGDVNKVYHFPFDIYRLNGEIINCDFPTLKNMFKNTKHIKVPRFVYGGVNEFEDLWKQIVIEEKGEGIVATDPSKPNIRYRIKHIMTADVVVVAAGNIDEKAWAKGQIGYLRLAILDENNDFLLTSKVGTGFSKPERIELFKYVNENQIELKDKEFWLPPKLIAEVKYRRHRFIKVPLLKYEDNKYINIGEDDGVMMAMTSFIRFRDDKRIEHRDLSINQFPL